MERRGSGLTRIVEETKKLVGFSKEYMPEFESTQAEFRTTLKNNKIEIKIKSYWR